VTKELSPGKRDPWMRLVAAIVERAVNDLGDIDPISALDALDWFLGDAYVYLDALGYELDTDQILEKVVNYGT